MRTIAILAAIVVGAAVGMVVGSILDMAVGTEGTIGMVGFLAGAIGLPLAVAALVPRSPRTQARHDQAMQRINQFRR